MDSHISDPRAFQDQVLDLLQAFGTFGKTAEGGYSRLAAGPEEKRARDHLCGWLRDHGFTVIIDPVGNIFGVLDLCVTDSERAFFCGSHLDSQPNGGNFDGCLGVVCACVAALFLKERIAAGQVHPAFRYYVVTCWTGEEGARFQPSLIGSSVFSGALHLEDAWRLRDGDGILLKDALQMTGYLGSGEAPRPDHYLELHIEQGTELERAGRAIALVEACWGAEKLRVVVTGKADHTGPTPMAQRRNALLAASHLVVEIEALAQEARETLHSSVGRMVLEPNSPNTIVERAELWIEVRSPSEAALKRAAARIDESMTTISRQSGCDLAVSSRERRSVVCFDETALEDAERALADAGIGPLKLTTIAGHDAVRLQSVCPSTLLFVPSQNGITHSPLEFTTDADVRAGFEAMTAILARLISRPAGARFKENDR